MMAAIDVETARITLRDESRRRDIPAKIYAPRTSSSSAPAIVFSHGMGESRDAYEYLGRAWAGAGYVSIHLTHAGTDRAVLENEGLRGIVRATRNPENWKNRTLDISFAISAMGKPDTPLMSTADWSRVAVAGHSAGAFTALTLAGLIIEGDKRALDPRVKAVIAMSMPSVGSVLRDNAYSQIAAPVLHITGTRDYSILYRTIPSERRVAFDRTMSAHDQYLFVLKRATHNTFSNLERWWRRRDSALKREIERVSSLFLDAYLKGDAAARAALQRALEFKPGSR